MGRKRLGSGGLNLPHGDAKQLGQVSVEEAAPQLSRLIEVALDGDDPRGSRLFTVDLLSSLIGAELQVVHPHQGAARVGLGHRWTVEVVRERLGQLAGRRPPGFSTPGGVNVSSIVGVKVNSNMNMAPRGELAPRWAAFTRQRFGRARRGGVRRAAEDHIIRVVAGERRKGDVAQRQASHGLGASLQDDASDGGSRAIEPSSEAGG